MGDRRRRARAGAARLRLANARAPTPACAAGRARDRDELDVDPVREPRIVLEHRRRPGRRSTASGSSTTITQCGLPIPAASPMNVHAVDLGREPSAARVATGISAGIEGDRAHVAHRCDDAPRVVGSGRGSDDRRRCRPPAAPGCPCRPAGRPTPGTGHRCRSSPRSSRRRCTASSWRRRRRLPDRAAADRRRRRR